MVSIRENIDLGIELIFYSTEQMHSSHFCRREVDEDMVVIVNGMGISVRITASALEILSTYKAAIDVDV